MSNFEVEFSEGCFNSLVGVPRRYVDKVFEFPCRKLRENPYVFDRVELAYGVLSSVRYFQTKIHVDDEVIAPLTRAFTVPPLVAMFTIDEARKVVRIIDVRTAYGFGDLEF